MLCTFVSVLLLRGALLLRTGRPAADQPPVMPQPLAQGASAGGLLSGQVHASLERLPCWAPWGPDTTLKGHPGCALLFNLVPPLCCRESDRLRREAEADGALAKAEAQSAQLAQELLRADWAARNDIALQLHAMERRVLGM